MDDNAVLNSILKRLDILISLGLEKPLSEKPTTIADRIVRLQALGLSPSEIAAVLGKPTNYVTATISQKKTRHAKGGRNRD